MGKTWLLAAVAGVLLLNTGCSGINASHSVSPASFFLPGLLYAPPGHDQPAVPTPDSEPPTLVARAR